MLFSDLEKQAFAQYEEVAGVDEAGRGCLAGPVSTAAVAVSRGDFASGRLDNFCAKIGLKEIRDSKKLTPKKRQEIFAVIKEESAIKWRAKLVGAPTIDRVNIWQATLLGWQDCLAQFGAIPDMLFIDGALSMPNFSVRQQAVVGGDAKIFIVSLASIIAKVLRDAHMTELDLLYPGYGFAVHKGYGTKAHFASLAKLGVSAEHRRSFQPVFAALSFAERIRYVVSHIPQGQSMTYQEVARAVGEPNAYRAVGNVLNKKL